MFLRPTSSLLGAALGAGLAFCASTAHADSAGMAAPATCDVQFSYGRPVSLPANAPALLVIDRTQAGLTATLDVALVDGATRTTLTADTDDHGLSVFALPQPLTPGAYTLDGTLTCSDHSGERPISSALTVTEEVPFPTAVGSLVHVPSNPPTGMDKLRLEPTAGMRAFLDASQLTMVVDGANKGPIYGATLNDGIELVLHTGAACVKDGALLRDRHTMKVSVGAVIAGVADVPAVADLDVEVDCGAIKWTSGTNGTEGTVAGEDGTTSDGSSSSTGGCSAAPNAASGSFAAVGAGLVAVVAAARRRRRA